MAKQAHQIFYDDQCPLCNAEINHYKKLTHIQAIDWVAISTSEDVIKQHGLTKEAVLKRIHAINNEGKVISGAAVFSLIWNSLKPYQFAGKLIEALHLVPVLDFFYKYFAEWRYKRNNAKCSTS